jgi:hypothetical protein
MGRGLDRVMEPSGYGPMQLVLDRLIALAAHRCPTLVVVERVVAISLEIQSRIPRRPTSSRAEEAKASS